ncbi:DUF4232 domain-containing protein [Streptomyces albofaciens JCM 4342]|uniref:DUF4232 domain-containing protein n=1 Tax=Streptomyces albofaciens TaxID=66866 RepID=UPI00123856A1|nr:DUF4232 domain-containing protein [Streptomyces albofaciens]KAA6214479.1 DUF4232 domain-containing protein [Streptomyces albofaciens JCM 4342]
MSSSTAVRTARRRTLRIAAAALTAAAGLALTACSGTEAGGGKAAAHLDSEAAAAQSPGDKGSSADAQGSGPQADSGTKAEGKAGARAGAGAGAGATGKRAGTSHATGNGSGSGSGRNGASGTQRCHTSDLTAAFATGEDATPDPNAGGSTTTSIVLTNKSHRTCKIGGFAGVDLQPDAGGPSWSLARSAAKHGTTTLAPGDSTDFTVNLGMAKENDEGSWKPATVAVTPPNETTPLTLKWPWGPLIHQDGATHPATFVNPIG